MTEALQPQTELDAALDLARGDAQRANFFYDAFLNAELFMPVQRQGVPGSWQQLTEADRFQPMFLNYQETKVVPLFDSLPRLQQWAGEKRLDYIQLRCHMLIVLFAAEVAMVLNLATPWSYYFSPETLEKLRSAMKPVDAN